MKGTKVEGGTSKFRRVAGENDPADSAVGPTAATRETTVDDAPFALAQLEGESSVEFQKRSRAAYVAREARKWEALAAEPLQRPNPLLLLDEERSARLFVWLRECPFQDAVKQMLAEQGIPEVSEAELNEFFETEANAHWQRRLGRAATEANALVSYVEQHPMKFSSGILAALGQEAFRQIANGDVAPEAMTRMVNLFLKARGDERADQVLELKREKMRRDWHDETERALEAFAVEIEKHPEARAAFEALRMELLRKEGA